MRADRFDLPLRIVVEDPAPGAALALWRRKSVTGSLEQYAAPSDGPLTFDLGVVVEGSLPDGRPRLLGSYVQGPPRERFVYLCVGYAGQAEADWAGRVKVPLGGITWTMIDALSPGARLEARAQRRAGPGERPDPGAGLARGQPLAGDSAGARERTLSRSSASRARGRRRRAFLTLGGVSIRSRARRRRRTIDRSELDVVRRERIGNPDFPFDGKSKARL